MGHGEIKIPINILNHLLINPEYEGEAIQTLYEDDLFIAINKPSKIHCHPLSYDEKDNCLSFLSSSHRLENKSSYDRTLLYRLDYETSGVLTLAKNESDYKEIRENFDEIVIEKIYFAIVEGKGLEKGIHTHHFSASEHKGHKQKEDPIGRSAKLEIWDIIEHENQNLSLVKLKLKTGIRHQIRVQLSHLGHPILGDELYGGSPAKRLFLHAYKYSFRFKDKDYEFTSSQAWLFDEFFNLNSIS